MENKKQLSRASRQRKMLLILPLIALPFLTMLFWAMGGGKAEATKDTPVNKGFNIKLPNSSLTADDPMNKLNYYDQAALDSMKFEELKKKDPNYSDPTIQNGEDSLAISGLRPKKGGLIMSSYRDPNEEKVYRKLEALQKAISTPTSVVTETKPARPERQSGSIIPGDETERLEAMLQSMDDTAGEDQELQQINGMLENILDIQHPGRMQEKLRKASEAERGQVFSVGSAEKQETITLLQENSTKGIRAFGIPSRHNGFYSLEQSATEQVSQRNAIAAVIAETQTILNGSTIKMRLVQDVYINGVKIPKDSFVYGLASLKGERLSIKINTIRFNTMLFPVELAVYDLDGLDGIFIPGAINRDVAKASADRSMSTLGVGTLDDSWEAQAAGAGFEAAKSLFSKKVKLVKVVVKAGYQILLYDEKQKDKS